MDLFAFIKVADPTKVKSELEASVERLFDEGGSADQEDSAGGGGQDAGTGLVTGVKIIVAEDVTTKKPKCPRKKRQAVTDASGSCHPPKKLRGDYRTSGEVATSGKSPRVLKELLARSMLNVKAGVAAVATLPMVTSSVYATPEHKSGAPANFIIGLNLCTIGASERFAVVSSVMTEAMVTSHVATTLSVPKTGTKVTYLVYAYIFHYSDSMETVKADATGPSYSARQDLSIGFRELDAETLHQVFIPQWNVLNDSLLDDYDVSREFIDHLAPLALFYQICEMDYHHMFTEFNIRTARQACLNVEVKMRTEYCLCERKRLESECEKQTDLLKARDDEIENLKAQLLLKETKAAKSAHLMLKFLPLRPRRKNSNEIDALKQRNVALKNEKESLDGKVAELQSSVSTKDLEQKDLNVVEYLSALGATISRAIKKGMQDGLSAGINHGTEGRSLASVVVYNPAAKADYNSALQRLREVDFPLLAELKSHKNAKLRGSAKTLQQSDQLLLVFGLLWLSVENLVGEADTFDSVPVTIATTTALSTTFASASSVPPITIEDYEIIGRAGYYPERDPPSGTNLVMVLFDLSFVVTIDRGHLWQFCSVPPTWGLAFLLLPYGLHHYQYTRTQLITENRYDLRRATLALFTFVGRVSSVSSSTNTCLLRCAKLVDAILLSALAFLFSLLETCLIENVLKPLVSVLSFSKYRIISASFAIPAPEPSAQDEPSVNKVHGSGSSSSTSMAVIHIHLEIPADLLVECFIHQTLSKEGKAASSKALDVRLIVTKYSGTKSDKQDTSSRSKNDTYVKDVDIKPVNDKEPMAKVQSPKTRNSNKPIEPKIHTQKPGRQIVTGYRFSPNKSSIVHEKTNTLRSCLSSGLVPNSVSQQPCIPPNRDDWDYLFQPMFNEYFNPPTISVSLVPVAAAPRAVDLADSPVSTLIDQDALSISEVDLILFTRKARNDLLLGILTSDSVDTPMVEKSNLDEDPQGKPVDATLYCGMIGSLVYLTSRRPGLIYVVCLCALYQAKPIKST
nr:hypothetical protein [Tanacetum cinerariifolium]